MHLPDGPDAVDFAVVDPEGRVVGRGVEVTARVAGNGVVACRVDAHAAAEATGALHHVLEGGKVSAVLDQAEDVLGAEVAAREVVGDVTAEAARVASVAVGAGVTGRSRVDGGRDRAESYDHAVWKSEMSVSTLVVKERGLGHTP